MTDEQRGWIDVRERAPEEKDADATGRVLVWHALNGCMLIGWFKVTDNRFITHWKRSPEGPAGHAELAKRAIWGKEERFI